MRRLREVFEEAVSPGSLWRAWRTFRKGKRSRPSVRAFEVEADRRLLALHRDLAAGTYRPGGFRLLTLREPKRRLIAAAPVRDRVVHHAIYQTLAPRLDAGLLPTTYACLPGRGAHRALLAFLGALRRYRFVLCLDVRHYFLSIDRSVLGEVLRRKIKDRPMLELLATVAASGAGLYRAPGVAEFLGLEPGFPPPGCGLPIGNLTSQWWGNHYLSGLDHFAKRQLKVPHYQRYMDDLTLFSDSRAFLEEAREAVAAWLGEHRRLRLKVPGAAVRSTRGTLSYLGHRVSRAGIAPSAAALRRFEARLGELVLRGDREAIRRSIASYRGVLVFGGIPREAVSLGVGEDRAPDGEEPGGGGL